MKKIDLSEYPTENLKSLQAQIKSELSRRGAIKQKHINSIMRRISVVHGFAPIDVENENIETLNIKLFNSQYLLELPSRQVDLIYREPYLSSLLAQNWKHLFPRDKEDGEYYVYAHVDPRRTVFVTNLKSGGNYGGRPFYIGKGVGNRAFDLKRNEGHGKTIKELLKDGFPSTSIVRLIFTGLSEQNALEIESKLIYFFGSQFSNKIKGFLVNLIEPPIPDFIGKMKYISQEENLKSEHQS